MGPPARKSQEIETTLASVRFVTAVGRAKAQTSIAKYSIRLAPGVAHVEYRPSLRLEHLALFYISFDDFGSIMHTKLWTRIIPPSTPRKSLR